MTQDELARLAGVHRNSIGTAENKKADDLKDVEILRSAFGVFGLNMLDLPAVFPEGEAGDEVAMSVESRRQAAQKGAA